MYDPVAPPQDPPIDLEKARELLQTPIIPEVVAPLVEAAARQLRDVTQLDDKDVGHGVFEDMIQHFRQILARTTNLVLVQRYTSFHLVHDPLWRPRAAAPGYPADRGLRTVLDAYIQWEEIEKVLAPDGPYPALAELLARSQHYWLRSAEELLERVARHRATIAALIGVPEPLLGPLTGLDFGVSDPHNDGRTVAILRFGSRRIVYKPRPLDAEQAWNTILSRVNEAVTGQPPSLPRIASFDEYGFMEFILDAECETEEAVERCYRRYGILMATAHAMGAVDLHHENIIVSGENPIVIDCEPLFRAHLATSAVAESRLQIEQNLSYSDLDVRESVLELGVLPTVMNVPVGVEQDGKTPLEQEIDIGALCAYAATPFRDMLPCAMGTDHVHMRPYPVVARSFPNLPRLAGAPRLPKDYIDQIIAGFRAAHRYLSEHKADFTAKGGLLDAYPRCRIRLLVRPTMDYMSVFIRSLSPQVLRSQEKRQELIRRDMKDLGNLRMDTANDATSREIASIYNGDIPFFSLEADQSQCIETRLLVSPLESAKARWNAMDEFDCVLQVAQIRERLLGQEQEIVKSRPASMDRGEILRHAFDIAGAIADAAIDYEGAPCWVYASYAPGVSATMAHMDRDALYEGGAGTALVLAEIAARADRKDWMDLAIRVFDPLVKHRRQPRCISRGGGLGRGLGGLIYALVRIARVSGQEALLDTANRLALERGERLVEQQQLDEMLYGRAGFLLALLSLHRSSPNAQLEDLAAKTAQCLIRSACIRDGTAFWPVPNGREMPNPSHGASGIAMALARWAPLSGEDRAERIALMALRHDDRFWVEQESGWADGRFQDVEMPMRTNWSWCNGRSGGLLARLAVAAALESTFVTETVARALDAADNDILTDVSPGLCCGTPGAVDALLEVLRHHRHDKLAEQTARAVALMARRSPQSHYLMLSNSLFSGTAGLAFGFLRAACPESVESILWLA